MSSTEAVAGSTQRAHVLYLDIVESSLRSMNDQRTMYNELNDAVCGTNEYIRAKAAHSVLCRPSGDGMALVFLDHVEAPLRCALEIATELKQLGSVAVRMGIHSGEIYRVTDINGVEDVTGEGIVVARRVMDCGDAGHILLSSAAAEELEKSPEWHEWLHLLGACSVKHGKRVAIWNAYQGDLGNRKMPAIMVEQIAQEVRASARQGRPWFIRSRSTAAALALLVTSVVAWPLVQERVPTAWATSVSLVPIGLLILCLIRDTVSRNRP